MGTDRAQLSEQDIRCKFFTPAILAAVWNLYLHAREEFALKAGRVVVRVVHLRRLSSNLSHCAFDARNEQALLSEALVAEAA